MLPCLSDEIANCQATLLAVFSALPRRENMQQELSDADAAQERGYYLPEEDDRLRELFARYLEVREALRSIVLQVEPWVDQGEKLERADRVRVFIIGFTAACYLVRSGLFMVRVVGQRKVVRKKLDEAELRFGIPRKSFTKVYRLISSVPRMWKFHEAWTFYDQNKEEIYALKSDPLMKPVIDLLINEEPFMETRRRTYLKQRIRYRIHSFRRRNRSTLEQSMFRLLEIGGRTVSELRDPTTGLKKQPKRAPGKATNAALSLLEPGDIIITRHRDALSNLFLPGFWPHGALFVGDLGEGELNVMEAKKDGVLLRTLEETLTVDSFLILRAKLDRNIRETAAKRALTHRGKLYDFAFDFTQSERLVCTALIYHSWQGQGGVNFELGQQTGRTCLSAENIIRQGIESNLFEVVGYFGPNCESLCRGSEAGVKFGKQFFEEE